MLDVFSIVFFALFTILVLFGLIRGAMRGGLRAGIRLGMVLLCAIVAFIAAQPIADSLLTLDVSMLELPAAGDTVFVGTLGEYFHEIVAAVMGVDLYNDIMEASPTVITLITSIICAVVAEIVFLLAFYVLKLVTYIIFCIVRIFIPKRDKNGVKLKKNRLVGMAFGVVQAVVILLVLLVPVTGVVSIVEKVETAIAAAEEGIDEHTASLRGDTATSLLGASAEMGGAMSNGISSITDGVAYTIIRNAGVDKITVGVFDRMYRVEVTAEGEKAYLVEELEKLIPLAGDIFVIADSDSVTAEQVCAVIEKVENSVLITGIASDFLRTASAHWAEGERFLEITIDDDTIDPEHPYTAEVLRRVLASFTTLDRESFVSDLDILREVVILLDENEVMELINQLFDAENAGEETENEGEFDEEGAIRTLTVLMQILEKRVTHEDGTTATLTGDLFAAFAESPRYREMIPALLNLGIYSATTSLELPFDDAAMYDLMIDELVVALQDISFDYAAVEQAILHNAVNEDYNAYMTAYKRVMRVFSNRGLMGYDGLHVFPIDDSLYAYMSGEWGQVFTEDEESTVALIADALIRASVAGETMDKAGIIRIASNLTNGGVSAEHLADRSRFVSEHATFCKIEIHGEMLHGYDYPMIGDALAHMTGAFIDVMEHTEENEQLDANVFLSLEYGALGTALDELYSIDAMKELCYGLMDVVTNMTDLEDQQSVRNAVANLKTNLEHGDTTFTKFFGAVGAAVQISNRIESTDNISDLDWSESLKDLSDADDVSLGVVKEMLGGITNVEENTQTNTDLTNLMGTLIDSVNNNFQEADEETYVKEGEALKNTIASLEQSTSISDVIKGVATNSAESVLVKDVMLEAVITAGDRINNNEEYLSINFSRDEIVKTETGESNEGSELMGAVIDSLTQMEEEHFTSDMQTLGNVMETLENAGVDFSAEYSADKVTEAMADESIRADVIAALQGSQDNGSSTFDALLAILNKKP